MANPKQVIVIRKDLKMGRGKEIAQGAHASMKWLAKKVREAHGVMMCLSKAETAWIEGLFTKITLQVDSEKDLVAVYDAAKEAGLVVEMVNDRGLTQFKGVITKTCLAIGPDYPEKIDPITKHLKLY